jgi:site-specific recombinase XerD
MSDPTRVRVTGPLADYAAGFRAELESQGYRPNAVGDQLYVTAHVSRWLESRGLEVPEFTPEQIEAFLVARRKVGYTLWLSHKGVAPLVEYLRKLGVVPVPEAALPVTPEEHMLEAFRIYLVEERGLASGSVAADLHMARLFLSDIGARELGSIGPADIIAFVKKQCEERSARYVNAGLRAFLRFCHLTGQTPTALVHAVPKVASWRLAGIPKTVDRETVKALLSSCDRRTTYGRRDFAVLMLLVRMGLRSGEVASLRLDDIDWRAGEILIRGKGSKFERLPLPKDVGEAIAALLRRGRPRCDAREVITRIRAPHGVLSPAGIYAIVKAASERAGVTRVHPHQLRHTAATEMLCAGASLDEIGQVLRHRSMLTTAIYAKVDRNGLRELASPWPALTGVTVKP